MSKLGRRLEIRDFSGSGPRFGTPQAAEEPPDAHYFGAKKLGHGQGYVYPPDDPAGYQVDYLPDEPKGKQYYEPSGNGEERER